MCHPVFVSYARSASATQAKALADKLGDLAFLDTGDVDDGDQFPQRLLDGVLDARVVVIFATQAYSERVCRLEMRLSLAGGTLLHRTWWWLLARVQTLFSMKCPRWLAAPRGQLPRT